MTKVIEYMAMGKATVAFDLQETLYTAGRCALYATDNSVAQPTPPITVTMNP